MWRRCHRTVRRVRPRPESDVPGLITQADSFEAPRRELPGVIQGLLEDDSGAGQEVELARRARCQRFSCEGSAHGVKKVRIASHASGELVGEFCRPPPLSVRPSGAASGCSLLARRCCSSIDLSVNAPPWDFGRLLEQGKRLDARVETVAGIGNGADFRQYDKPWL
jgi:hypothetical protein